MIWGCLMSTIAMVWWCLLSLPAWCRAMACGDLGSSPFFPNKCSVVSSGCAWPCVLLSGHVGFCSGGLL
ncbi:BnaAnng39100D [Brassica napus]|uniref:(rape) hypothetical protein n=1 Tax=Brassica napus TaxID=3708 RepID=A0A078JZS8_BRANA|nr:unnamed protein product [Brassica napus]CDY71870.1 BnaAnng39100D [Brassica napus]